MCCCYLWSESLNFFFVPFSLIDIVEVAGLMDRPLLWLIASTSSVVLPGRRLSCQFKMFWIAAML
jgi:hypothetical protein